MSDTFDPNQPYQEVDESQRPAFDPSQPYQEIDQAPQGPPPEPDHQAMRDHVTMNLKARDQANQAPTADGAKPKREPIDVSVKPVEAESFADSLAAGLGMSVSGLLHGAPTISVTDHQNLMYKIGSMIGQTAGDLPWMAAGMVGGATVGASAGAATGTAVGPGIGTVVGMGAGAIGGGYFGSGALPAGMRKLLIDHYQKGDIQDAGDFASRLMAASWEAVKGGTLNVAMMGAGSAAKGITAGAKPFVTNTAALAAELNTMAVGSAALEGRLPNKSDFTNAGIMIAGVHGTALAVPKLMAIYKATGEHPVDVAEAMTKDPKLKQEILAANPDLPKIEVNPEAEAAAKPDTKSVEGVGEVEQPLTEEQHQAKQAVDVAKEARDSLLAEDEEPAPFPKNENNMSDAEKEILSYVGEQPEIPKDQRSFAAKVGDAFSDFYIKHFDFTKGFGRILAQLGLDPKAEENPEILASLHSEVGTKIKGFFTNSTRDFKTGEVNGEGYDQIVRDYKTKFPEDPSMDGLRAYMIAKRVLEKAGQGMDIVVHTGMAEDGEVIDKAKAQEVVNAGAKKYEKFNQRRIDFRNRVLEYVHDSGFWTKDQFQAMKDANEDYASFHRVQDLDPLLGKAPGPGRGVFRMKGEGGLIVDPLVSDVKDTVMLIRMAEENKVKAAAVKQLATGDDSAFLRKAEPNMKITKVSAQELSKHLDANMIDHDPDTVDGMNVFRSEKARVGANQIEVHVDGERQVYEGAPETIELLNRLRGLPAESNMFSNMLRTAAAGIRMGTIGSPAFWLKHMFRNQIQGGTYSETGLLPFQAALKAPEMGSPRWNDFLHDGGAQSSLVAFDDQWVQSRIFDIEKKAPFMDRAYNLVHNAAQLSHAAIITNDNLIRYSEYSRMLDQGSTRTEAAAAARRVLPDVQTAGLQRSFFLTQTAFLGIHVKGLARQVEAIGDQMEMGLSKEALQGPLAKAVGMITMPAAMLAAGNWAMGTQGRIDRLLPWQKYGFFNAAVPDWRKATPEEAAAMPHEDLRRQNPDGGWEIDHGITFRMQMPFTEGVFFGGLVQTSIDAFRKKDPAAFYEWAKNVGESTAAIPIPNFATAPIAQVTNYQAFTGQPVIPDNKIHLAPELQYEPYTTETAKSIGKLVGSVPYLGKTSFASPLVVEEYVRDWTGPIGLSAMRLADQALLKATGKRVAPQPQWEWADYPVIGAFVWRNDTAKTADIDEFTNRYLRADSLVKSVKELYKEQDPSGAVAFQESHQQEMQRLAGPYQAIHQMKHYIQAITANPEMDATTKRQLIEPVYYRMDEVAKLANKTMDNMQKSLNAQTKSTGE